MSPPDKKLRLFLGSFPSADEVALLRALFEKRTSLPEVRINWVPPENWHVTWLFLGDVAEARLDELRSAVRTGIGAQQAFGIEFNQLAFWGGKRAPQMLVWEGVETPTAFACHKSLEIALKDFNVHRESRPGFKPHLTLARIKPSKGHQPPVFSVERLLPQTGLIRTLRIDHIALVASTLTPNGAVYKHLERFPLPRP